MTNRKTYRIMLEIEAFPGMPVTATKLLPLLENADSSTSEIESILKYDPGLTANILKLTNSAYFGIPTQVSSVKQAIILLGWKRLLQVVMTICMSPLMQKTIPGYDMPRAITFAYAVFSMTFVLLVFMLTVPIF